MSKHAEQTNVYDFSTGKRLEGNSVEGQKKDPEGLKKITEGTNTTNGKALGIVDSIAHNEPIPRTEEDGTKVIFLKDHKNRSQEKEEITASRKALINFTNELTGEEAITEENYLQHLQTILLQEFAAKPGNPVEELINYINLLETSEDYAHLQNVEINKLIENLLIEILSQNTRIQNLMKKKKKLGSTTIKEILLNIAKGLIEKDAMGKLGDLSREFRKIPMAK